MKNYPMTPEQSERRAKKRKRFKVIAIILSSIAVVAGISSVIYKKVDEERRIREGFADMIGYYDGPDYELEVIDNVLYLVNDDNRIQVSPIIKSPTEWFSDARAFSEAGFFPKDALAYEIYLDVKDNLDSTEKEYFYTLSFAMFDLGLKPYGEENIKAIEHEMCQLLDEHRNQS